MADTRLDNLARVLAAVRARRVPGRRLMVAIAGPPGSGKSTLATELVGALNEGGGGSAALLPMDVYHLDNRILEQKGLLARKGATAYQDWAARLHDYAYSGELDAEKRYWLEQLRRLLPH